MGDSSMKFTIKSIWGHILFECEGESRKQALSLAVQKSADMSCAGMPGADLRGAKLQDAKLPGANLFSADLRGAKLQGAELQGANMQGAELRGANMQGANLQDANLQGANMQGANLQGAKLQGANLQGANMQGAKLSKKDIERIYSQRTLLPAGELIVYKQVYTDKGPVICTLRIPAKAKRVGGTIGRKCRAEYAYVINGSGYSYHNNAFVYRKGKKVVPDKYDPNPLVDCSHGIHFFITKQEAEAY